MRRQRSIESQIPEKANRILGGILVFLLLIVCRIWHLSIVQHEAKIEEASRPQRRTVVEKPQRATISDREGIPLAINRVQYNASLSYAPIREVKRVAWVEEGGKRIKKYLRKEYITELSQKLAELLHLDAQEIEDIIYAKAAILGAVPYPLKESISEECYFKLKMLEQSWPGIVAEVVPKRVYPHGSVGGELIGYIGPISGGEYSRIIEEMQRLREEENFDALEELEKRACSLNDLTGKMGVEAAFDTQLRGERGKKIFLADTRGNFLRTLPGGIDPLPGKPLQLTISSRLQAFCEKLLIDYEQEPQSMRPVDVKRRTLIPPKQPWIKGGAIVVLDPKNGEVLAMASHPRFDPNDFIAKKPTVHRILETESNLAQLWEFRQPLTRERFDFSSGLFTTEELPLTWDNYLSLILPQNTPLFQRLQTLCIHEALEVQKNVEGLLSLFEADARKVFDVLYEEDKIGVEFTLPERDYFASRVPEVVDQIRFYQANLAPFFEALVANYDKLLFVDLCRLLIDKERFADLSIGNMTVSDYRLISGHFFVVEEAVKEIVHALFMEKVFSKWRDQHFKNFLLAKRKMEKAERKQYAKPYTDYLKEQEQELFSELWERYRFDFIKLFLTGEGEAPFADDLRLWAEELMQGAYPALPWHSAYTVVHKGISQVSVEQIVSFLRTFRSFDELNRPLLGRYTNIRSQTEKHLAAAFYPRYGYGVARSFAFRQATVIGSIFKLVPAYEAMRQKYERSLCENRKVGDLNPLTIIDDKHKVFSKGWNVGFTMDGRPIPLFYRGGRLPRSEHAGVGRVDVERALETSSNPYFSMLAGDVLEDPEDLVRAAKLFSYGEKTEIQLPNEYAGVLPTDVVYDRTGLYSMAIGQHSMVGTPLQTAVMLAAIANGGRVLKPKIVLDEPEKIRWELFMPEEIQRKLIHGMQRVVLGEKGTARFVKSSFPKELCERFVGKTSTAEVISHYSLDGKNGRLKAKDIWFGGILYRDQACTEPDLVIVVYLKEGVFGRLAAPYAFKVAQFYEESLQSR